MEMIRAIIKSVRVKQWVKNLFVFLPIIFGGQLFEPGLFFNAVNAVFIFCLASGGIYLVNDIRDRKEDCIHPAKRGRPIASGLLSRKIAFIVAALFTMISLYWALLLTAKLFWILLAYIVIHLLYTFSFKKAVILDVIVIALGFEMRVWGGAVVVGVLPSVWLQLCVFLLALFLGFIKRRHEKTFLLKNAAEHRGVLSQYQVYFLDQMILISATLCIVFYGLYTISFSPSGRGGSYMAYTIPFVIYGIFRYLYAVHIKKLGGDPGEVLMSDMPLLLSILIWISTIVLFLYHPFLRNL